MITNEVPTCWASCTKCYQTAGRRCSERRLVGCLMPARGGWGRRDATGAGASNLDRVRSSSSLASLKASRASKRRCRRRAVGDWETWWVGSSGRLDQSIAVVVLFRGERQKPKQDVTRKFGWVFGAAGGYTRGGTAGQTGAERVYVLLCDAMCLLRMQCKVRLQCRCSSLMSLMMFRDRQ